MIDRLRLGSPQITAGRGRLGQEASDGLGHSQDRGLDNGAVKETEGIIDKSGRFDKGLEELRRELPKLQEAMRRLTEAGTVKKPEGWDETQGSGEG